MLRGMAVFPVTTLLSEFILLFSQFGKFTLTIEPPHVSRRGWLFHLWVWSPETLGGLAQFHL